MNIKELKELLEFFPEDSEVYMDMDDTIELNLQSVEHIFPVHFKDGRHSILVIDADWAGHVPTVLEEGEDKYAYSSKL